MAVFYGTPNDLGAVLGSANQDAMQYINQSVNRFMDVAGHVGQAIADRVNTQYQAFVDSTIGNRAAAIKNMVNAMWQDDSIRPLTDWGEVQNAPLQMVPYLMANPTVRELYHADRIEGYGDRYLDKYPDSIGRDHYTYRRVTNGMVQSDGHWNEYYEQLHKDDVILNLIEKTAILSSWETMDDMVDDGLDPTNPWNDPIG